MELSDNIDLWKEELEAWKRDLSLWKKVITEEPYQIYKQLLRVWEIRDVVVRNFLILSAILAYVTTICLVFGSIFIYFDPGLGDISILHVILIIPAFIPFPVVTGVIFVGLIYTIRGISKAISKPLKPIHENKQLKEEEIEEIRIEVYRWTLRGTYSYAIPVLFLYTLEEILGIYLNDLIGNVEFPVWLYSWLFGNTPLSIIEPLITYISEFPTSTILLLIFVIVIPGSLYAAAIRRYFVIRTNSIGGIDQNTKYLLGFIGIVLSAIYLLFALQNL